MREHLRYAVTEYVWAWRDRPVAEIQGELERAKKVNAHERDVIGGHESWVCGDFDLDSAASVQDDLARGMAALALLPEGSIYWMDGGQTTVGELISDRQADIDAQNARLDAVYGDRHLVPVVVDWDGWYPWERDPDWVDPEGPDSIYRVPTECVDPIDSLADRLERGE
jgi:hypothetical protein